MDMKSFTQRFKVMAFKAGYHKLAQQEEDGLVRTRDTVALDSEYHDDDEEAATLLDNTQTQRRPKRKACCMCCGLNCSLFWKVIGILVGVGCIFYGVKFTIWVLTPTPTGLENMPAYSASLECSTAEYIYNSSTISVHSPIGSLNNNHFLDIKGLGVGTVTIATAEETAEDVEYRFTIRSNNLDLLDHVEVIHKPSFNEDGSVEDSRLVLKTPFKKDDDDACVYFDTVIYVPRELKTLGISSHAKKTHVRYHPDAQIYLATSFFVTLYGTTSDNMILPNEGVHSPHMGLEVFNGWIVGNVAVGDDASIKTQRGLGVTNVKLHPLGFPSDDPASILTVTGAGRTDVTYLGGSERRPIRSTHMSTGRTSNMYLAYSSSGFSGRIELDATSHTATGLQPLGPSDATPGKTKDTVKNKKWTHFVGAADGPDEIRVDTRGWAGLYM